MVETRERGKQPYRETRRTPCTGRKTRKTQTLLNLHWLFCLRISAKSWTTFCRDRIAPNCTIRHPVWPIVALQRRVRFSVRLAGFCRIRWHQRRARRAERASFSVFVSNLDFRVPRLRQRGEWVADRAVQRRKRGCPRGPESRAGLPRRSRLARSGPGAARAWIQVSARVRGIPLLDGVFPARTGNPNRRHRLRPRPRSGARHGSMTIETARRASLEFVCVIGQDGHQPSRISFNVLSAGGSSACGVNPGGVNRGLPGVMCAYPVAK